MDKYNLYTTEDFLNDKDFVQHIKFPNEVESSVWKSWKATGPSNIESYQEAAFYLRGILSAERILPSEEFVDNLELAIHHSITERKSKRVLKHRIIWGIRVAAAVILILVVPLLLREELRESMFSLNNRESISKDSVHQKVYDNSISIPDIDRVVLTDQQGRDFEIEELENGIPVNWNGLQILRSSLHSIEFRPIENRAEHKISNVVNQTIKIPKGVMYSVLLPDGTRVRLNALSKLSFPAFFERERRVYLDGEGYFEVAKDSTKQFIVASGIGESAQEIVVYGTSFNVSAFKDSRRYVTTLVEGSVKFVDPNSGMEQLLKPNEQLVFNKQGRFDIGNANLAINLAWINNVFYFVNLDARDALQQLGRWYDVQFIIQANDKRLLPRVFAQISREKSLSDVLSVLERTNDLTFEIKGKEVYVRY